MASVPSADARSSRRHKGAQGREGHVGRANPSRGRPRGRVGMRGVLWSPARPRPGLAAPRTHGRRSPGAGAPPCRRSQPRARPRASPPAAHPRSPAGVGGRGRGPGAGASRCGPQPLPLTPPRAWALGDDVSSALRPLPAPAAHPPPPSQTRLPVPPAAPWTRPSTRVGEGGAPLAPQVPLGVSPSSSPPSPGAVPACTPGGVCKASGRPHPRGLGRLLRHRSPGKRVRRWPGSFMIRNMQVQTRMRLHLRRLDRQTWGSWVVPNGGSEELPQPGTAAASSLGPPFSESLATARGIMHSER